MDSAQRERIVESQRAGETPEFEHAGSSCQRHARDLGADCDEAVLQSRILGLRVRLGAL